MVCQLIAISPISKLLDMSKIENRVQQVEAISNNNLMDLT